MAKKMTSEIIKRNNGFQLVKNDELVMAHLDGFEGKEYSERMGNHFFANERFYQEKIEEGIASFGRDYSWQISMPHCGISSYSLDTSDISRCFLDILKMFFESPKGSSFDIGYHGFPKASNLNEITKEFQNQIYEDSPLRHDLNKTIDEILENGSVKLEGFSVESRRFDPEILKKYNLTFSNEPNAWMKVRNTYFRYLDPNYYDVKKPTLLESEGKGNVKIINNWDISRFPYETMNVDLFRFVRKSLPKSLDFKEYSLFNYLMTTNDDKGRFGFEEELGKLHTALRVKGKLEHLKSISRENYSANKLLEIAKSTNKLVAKIMDFPQDDLIGQLAKIILYPNKIEDILMGQNTSFKEGERVCSENRIQEETKRFSLNPNP